MDLCSEFIYVALKRSIFRRLKGFTDKIFADDTYKIFGEDSIENSKKRRKQQISYWISRS